ncbi:exosortase F system-associated membrane protein [Flavobacterium ardleyense]|uniref:exosortase F system-associated membrane protein n=1 Tax=Flavobacterium ardleyense TaxID=2038737 RepID=UPI00298C127F|nr:exosortase F system-associated protein [Flavobacterium ardleyense]
MLTKSNKVGRIAVAFALIIGLALVRLFESELFYDPLLAYFKSSYMQMNLPEVNYQMLFANISFRYIINTVLSLALLYAIFRDKGMIKFTAVLYFVFFIVLISILLFALSYENPDKMLIFYVRRFLIQPIFILLFIPGFLFQEYVNKKPEDSDAI